MNYFTKVRVGIANYILNKKQKKQNRIINVCNIKHAKTAGIICNSVNTENLKACKDLEIFLKENKVDAQVLGFNGTKQELGNIIGDNTHLYVNKKDFSFYYQPKSEDLKDFTLSNFDILFNIYQDHSIEVESIVRLSNASFKIGTAHFNTKIHDLMFNIEQDKRNPSYIIEQMQHYLSIINA